MHMRISMKQTFVHALCRALPDYDRSAPTKRGRSIRQRILSRVLHEILTRNRGLTVVALLNGKEIELPHDHSLLNLLAARPLYESEFNRLLTFSRSDQQPLRIIDIGANIGDTVIRAPADVSAEWLCIEAHPEFFALMEKNFRSIAGITCLLSAVSDSDEVSLVTFNERLGTASIATDTTPQATGAGQVHVRMESMAMILDGHRNFANAEIFKCDTDGFEPPIFRGAMPFLSRIKPRIYFELSPRHWSAYGQSTPDAGVDILRKAGYFVFLYYDEEGYLFGVDEAGGRTTLNALQAYTAGKKYGYWNVIGFHADDVAAANKFIASEMSFFAGL